jgi:hypothetical protein
MEATIRKVSVLASDTSAAVSRTAARLTTAAVELALGLISGAERTVLVLAGVEIPDHPSGS